MRHEPPETVTAGEIGDFAFCGEAWRLAQTGARSVNQPERAAGTRRHEQMADDERTAGSSIAIGRLLIAAALLALALLWVLGR